jgi:hypothetical protein
MIFMKNFYNEYHKVNTKNEWVWYVHIVSYSYIIYIYFFTDSADRDKSKASKMWIPLDIGLTICIFLYQLFYRVVGEKEGGDEDNNGGDETESDSDEENKVK